MKAWTRALLSFAVCGLLATSAFPAGAVEPSPTGTPAASAQQTPAAASASGTPTLASAPVAPQSEPAPVAPPAAGPQIPTTVPPVQPDPSTPSAPADVSPPAAPVEQTTPPASIETPVAPEANPDAETAVEAQAVPMPMMSVTTALPATQQLQTFLGIATGNTNPAINTQSNNDLGRNTTGSTITGGAPVFNGTDWSGNLASVATTGKSWSSDVTHVFADRGYVSRASDPNENVSANTRYYPNGSTSGQTFATTAGRGYVQDVAAMTTLSNELTSMRTALCSATPEAMNVLPSGDIKGTRTIDVDQYDTNGDGIAIIAVGSSGTDSQMDGATVIIEGSGNVLPIFRVVDGIHFKVVNSKVSLGPVLGAAMSTRPAPHSGAPDQAGAVFLKCNSGTKNFDFSNATVNGIAFWDLTSDTSPAMQLSNVTGCGQFIAPKQEWANVDLTRCAVGFSEPQPPAPTAESCVAHPTSYYMLRQKDDNTAEIYRHTPSGSSVSSTLISTVNVPVTPPSGHVVYDHPSDVEAHRNINGLGVTPDGVFYFTQQYVTRPSNDSSGPRTTRVDVWQWDSTTGTASTVVTGVVIGSTTGTIWTPYVSGGAVDPLSGDFFFSYNEELGSGSNKYTRLNLFRVTGTTAAKIATAETQPGTSPGDISGDIAFDGQGNLLFLVSSRTAARVGTIQADVLANAQVGTPIKGFTLSSPLQARLDQPPGGIAYTSDGELVMQALRTHTYRDPVSLNPLGRTWTSADALNNHKDLASCTVPPTLEVAKIVDERRDPSDQFTLTAGVGADLFSVTTQGDQVGRQADTLGPIAVRSGTQITIGEALAPGSASTDLGNSYTTTWACTKDGESAPFATGTGTTGTIAMSGSNVECVFTNTPRPTGAFACSPGEVYALNGYFSTRGPNDSTINGSGTASILQINTATGAATPTGKDFGFVGLGGQANAMGISPDGLTAYALVRNQQAATPLEVRKYDAVTGTVTTETTLNTALQHGIVAGAVDPLTGNYWVGGAVSGGDFWRFSVYTPGGTLVQQFRLNLGHAAGNGDLLFDYQGNMYVLSTAGGADPTRQNLWMIPAASLQAAIADPNPDVAVAGVRRVAQLNTTRTYHSAAWGHDGYIYVAASQYIWAEYPSSLYRIDPVTGTETLVGVIPDSGPVVDFASCSNPYTLTLKKDIAGRASDTDQFGLRIGGGGIAADSTAAYGQTSGSSTGVQNDAAAIAGPVPVLPGGSYTITETGIGATDLGNYEISYQCRDLSQSGNPILWGPTTVSPGDLPVALPAFPPNGGAGANVECVFTNTPKSGAVTWGKTDNSDPGVRLAGSVWTITGPSGPGSTELTVADCVGDAPADCAAGADKDHRAGYLQVTELAIGSYVLTEQTPPAGYLLSSEEYPFTIGGASLAVDLGDIVNHLRPGLVIPLTGGLGTDLFLLIGGGFAALLAAGLLYRHRKLRLLTASLDVLP